MKVDGKLDERTSTLIVIPGFLTEPHRLAQDHPSKALDTLDPTSYLDRRSWQRSINAVCDDRVNVECFEWGSQSALHVLTELVSPLIARGSPLALSSGKLASRIMQIATELHSSWCAARDEADRAVDDLCSQILSAPKSDRVTIIAHSLGARIALRALDRLYRSGERALPKLSAWAPAISESEMSCEAIAQLAAPPELIYSRADLVLKYIFPLGQGPRPRMSLLGGLNLITTLANSEPHKRALGLVGPPTNAPTLASIAQDFTDRPMTHLGYLPAAEYIFHSSLYLSELTRASSNTTLRRV